jgi:NitT/TauT family transport system permease protein
MRLPRPVIPLLLAAALLGGWEWAVRSGRADELFFPSPLHVLEWAWQGLLSGELLSATWVTVRRLALGFLIGAVLGVPLGAFCARVRWINDSLGLVAVCRRCLRSAGCRWPSSGSVLRSRRWSSWS